MSPVSYASKSKARPQKLIPTPYNLCQKIEWFVYPFISTAPSPQGVNAWSLARFLPTRMKLRYVDGYNQALLNAIRELPLHCNHWEVHYYHLQKQWMRVCVDIYNHWCHFKCFIPVHWQTWVLICNKMVDIMCISIVLSTEKITKISLMLLGTLRAINYDSFDNTIEVWVYVFQLMSWKAQLF